MRFHLAIYPPVPNDHQQAAETMDINPEITQLAFSTAIPGGFNGLSVGLRDPAQPQFGFLPRPINLKGFFDVTLYAGAVTVWTGRVMRLHRVGGEIAALEAIGYGLTALNDGWYGNTSGSPTTAGAVLADVIGQAAPLLGVSPDPSLFVDSGIEHAPREFDGMAPAQVVQQLATEGGGTQSGGASAPYDWQVWEDRIAWFVPRTAPLKRPAVEPAAGAQYWIDFDPEVEWVEDYTDAVGAVSVTYTGGSVPRTDTVASRSFYSRYGVQRAVNLQGGARSDAQAVQSAATYLSLHERPLVGVTVSRAAERGLRRGHGGAEQPPWLVRAGQWCQIGDQEPVILLATQYDANAQRFSATGANYPADYWGNLATLEDLTRSLQLAVNPVTGDSTATPYGVRTRYIAGTGAPAVMPESGGIVVTDAGLFANAGGVILGPIA